MPTAAINWPRVTRWPVRTARREQWAKRVRMPLPCSISTARPKPLSRPAKTTVPVAGATIGVPVGATTSMPSCGRFSCRIGWKRLDMNWLESQPVVGMMLGVFANLSKLRCSVSETTSNERANVEARAISPSTSGRALQPRRPRKGRRRAGWRMPTSVGVLISVRAEAAVGAGAAESRTEVASTGSPASSRSCPSRLAISCSVSSSTLKRASIAAISACNEAFRLATMRAPGVPHGVNRTVTAPSTRTAATAAA